nr:hypothetical protein BaRGS_009255 [Batillaria attramentaria]
MPLPSFILDPTSLLLGSLMVVSLLWWLSTRRPRAYPRDLAPPCRCWVTFTCWTKTLAPSSENGGVSKVSVVDFSSAHISISFEMLMAAAGLEDEAVKACFT